MPHVHDGSLNMHNLSQFIKVRAKMVLHVSFNLSPTLNLKLIHTL